jgi:DNA-directed RNA polymerase subunit M/transcription elongation factor TFIIS
MSTIPKSIRDLNLKKLKAVLPADIASTLDDTVHSTMPQNYVMKMIQIDQFLKQMYTPYSTVAQSYSAGKIQTSFVIGCVNNEITPRDKIRWTMSSLIYQTTKDTNISDTLGTAMELSCFNAVCVECQKNEISIIRLWSNAQFVDIYSSRCGVVLSLLGTEYNIVNKLIDGTIKPELVGTMSSSDMCPESFKKELDYYNIQIAQKIEVVEQIIFKCPRCKINRCTYQETQKRSADEASSMVCECLNCGLKFEGR